MGHRVTRLDPMSLQDRAAAWHAARFPLCTAGDIGLKMQAELGEVSDAILADDGRDASHPERAGTVLDESADVVVTLLALCGRFGHGDLLTAVSRKLALLETPGGTHPGCLPEGTVPVDDHEWDEGCEAYRRGGWYAEEIASQSASWQAGYFWAGRG